MNIIMQSNQVFIESEENNISASFPISRIIRSNHSYCCVDKDIVKTDAYEIQKCLRDYGYAEIVEPCKTVVWNSIKRMECNSA
jgi:hypothetical protein